ncbi:MAG: PAS domain S-box protein [Chloroflexi bacterium]|nr:PAS domain S-box protein [Chloroflexota bacterium]
MRVTTARALLHAARPDDAFIVTDGDRRLLQVNLAACRLLGTTEDQLMGRRVDDFLAPEAGPALHRRWRQMLGRGSAESTYGLRTADGVARGVALATVANCPLPGTHLARLRPVLPAS